MFFFLYINKLLLIVSLLYQQTLSNTNYIYTSLDVPNGGEIDLSLSINDEKATFNFDLIHSETVFKTSSFTEEILQNKKCTYLPKPLIPSYRSTQLKDYSLCYSNFNLFNQCNIDFYFHYPNSYIKYLPSSLSFAHKFANNKHSIIHQLYQHGYISKKQFSFQSKIKNLTNKLYLGEHPSSFISDHIYSFPLKVYKNETEWKFIVHSIKYGTYTRHYKQQLAYISSQDSDILVDKQTFRWLIDEVFKKYFDEGTCFMSKLLGRDTMCCKRKTYKEMTGMKIVIQGYEIDFPREYCFWCSEYDGVCYLNMVEINDEIYPDDANVWKIGYTFYQRFINVFDYDKHEIRLYTDKKDSFVYTGEGADNLNEYNDNSDILFIIYMGIGLLIPSIFSLLYLKIKYIK